MRWSISLLQPATVLSMEQYGLPALTLRRICCLVIRTDSANVGTRWLARTAARVLLNSGTSLRAKAAWCVGVTLWDLRTSFAASAAVSVTARKAWLEGNAANVHLGIIVSRRKVVNVSIGLVQYAAIIYLLKDNPTTITIICRRRKPIILLY